MTAPGVLLASGHMVDDPGRPVPRFPPGEVQRVTEAVRRALDDWGVDASTTVICGGARGADLIVAEQAHRLGARVVLCLAEPPEHFVRRSVHLPESDWTARFDDALEYADVCVLPVERAVGRNIHEATNTWMIELALERAARPDDPRAIVIWDGRDGDAEGGTRDFVRRLGFSGPDDRRLVVIDPTPSA